MERRLLVGLTGQSARVRGEGARRALAALSLALGGPALAGCSLLLDPNEEQCAVDADCAARGFVDARCEQRICVGTAGQAGAGPWSCLGAADPWPEPDPDVPARVLIQVVSMVGQTPFAGLEAKVCPPLDVADCVSPIRTIVSDDEGMLPIDVYQGFNGHLYAPAPASFPEMAPMILYVAPPPNDVETEPRDGNINVASIAQLTAIAQMGSLTVVPGTAHVFFTVLDCNMRRAAGVRVEVESTSPETIVAYIDDNGLPSDALTATRARGEGAVMNVPPGFVIVRATSEQTGTIGEASILAVADHITGQPIVPNL